MLLVLFFAERCGRWLFIRQSTLLPTAVGLQIDPSLVILVATGRGRTSRYEDGVSTPARRELMSSAGFIQRFVTGEFRLSCSCGEGDGIHCLPVYGLADFEHE